MLIRRRLDAVELRLVEISRLLNRLDAAVVVREPGNARAAEVFDGLRRTIVQASKSNRSHIAHLLTLRESLDRNASLDLVKNRVDDFLRELGIELSHDVSDRDAFDVVGGNGDFLELIEPAVIQWLDGRDTMIIQRGKARRVERNGDNAARQSAPMLNELVHDDKGSAGAHETRMSIPEGEDNQ